jgi:DNA-binding beta-propeller fold protein YncE
MQRLRTGSSRAKTRRNSLAVLAAAVIMLGATLSPAQVSVIGSLPDVPRDPLDVVADPLRGLLYVLVAGDAPPLPDGEAQPSVEVYSMSSGTKLDSINLDFTPDWGVLTPHAWKLIIRHTYDGCFSLVDLTDRTVDTICVQESIPIHALVSAARPNTAWLLFAGVSSPGTLVAQVNLTAPSVVDTILTPVTQTHAEGAVTPDGLTAIIPYPSSSEDNGTVSLIGLDGLISEAAVTELPAGKYPLHVVVTGDGSLAYVVNALPDALGTSSTTVIDLTTASVSGDRQLIVAAVPWRLALFDDDQRIAVLCLEDLVVQLFDVSGPGLAPEEHRIAMPGLSAGPPYNAPVVLDYADLMLVTEGTLDRISVIDIDPGSASYGSVERVDLGSDGHPARIAVSPSRGLAWVASAPGSTVTVLSIPKSSAVYSNSFESGDFTGWTVYPP